MFDVTLLGALVAGLLSFASPCVLPMVPFYLSYLAGTNIAQAVPEMSVTRDIRRRAIIGAILFALGVVTVFVALGATATVFGQFVRAYFDSLRWVAAAIIAVMGLHFLGLLRIGLLYRQVQAAPARSNTLSFAGAYVVGLAFAFGWTPCVGPVLTAILFTAAGQGTATQGAVLLFAYGAGMTLPFIVAAAFIGPFMAWMRRFRRHLGAVERAMGLLLIVFAVLIATNSMNLIAQWMLDHVPWFSTLG